MKKAALFEKHCFTAMLLFLVAALISVFCPDSSGFADAGRWVEKKGDVLRKARALLDKDELNRGNMRKAAAILESNLSLFPKEIRFPLYLAEAYNRMADPDGKIEDTFSLFRKSGFYAKKVLEAAPNMTEAHYWHGLYLLRKAQKKGIFGGYSITKKAIEEIEEVREALPSYDHGGASRVLAILYFTAPGWTPFGDIDRAVCLGEEAARLAPDYLLNRMYLARAYEKRGNKASAVAQYRKILSACSDAPDRHGDTRFAEEARRRLNKLL